jgi:protein tyrosine/serine phosphatase
MSNILPGDLRGRKLQAEQANFAATELAVHSVEGNIYRGPRPFSMAELEAAIPGVQYVIYLESGVYEEFHSDAYKTERTHPVDFNLVLIEFPLSDLLPPPPATLKKIVATLQSCGKKGRTYLHCLLGDDRTGISIAAYRMLVDGWTKERAQAEMFSLGFHQFPYDAWLEVLDDL